MFWLLLNGGQADVDLCDREGRSAILSALDARLAYFVKLLLERGRCDVNCEDDFGRTPLHLAAECEYPEIIRLLLTGKM